MVTMDIRIATEADLASVLEVYQALEGPWPMASGQQAMGVWAKICDHPGTTVFLGEVRNKPAAVATLHVLPNLTYLGKPYALIENVAVTPGLQRKGYGRLVMQAAIQAGWDADCYKIMLMAGVSNNVKGFYEALGFSADQKHALVMRKAPLRHERP